MSKCLKKWNAENKHGTVSRNKHGWQGFCTERFSATRTNRHGEKGRILYKFIDGKWFECKN